MKERILITIAGVPVVWDGDVLRYTAGMQVDADGSPRCYHPRSALGLDALANSGYPDKPWFHDVLHCTRKGSRWIPTVQDGRSQAQPREGFFISMTSYTWRKYAADDVRRYVDAEAVPYVVIPRHVPAMIAPRVLGCKALVSLGGMPPVFAVVVDRGPKNKIGEGSVKLAHMLGINPSPRNGGTSKLVITYEIFPGVPAVVGGTTYELRPAV